MNEENMTEIVVRLNGTDENPWIKCGLKQNPFPQIAKAELMSAMAAINSLDGEPIKGTNDIRQRLSGHMSSEFVELCVKLYQPGKRRTFRVNWPGAEDL